MTNVVQRTRLSVDVPVEMKRRLRIASAYRDTSLTKYIIDALESCLADDLEAGLYPADESRAMSGVHDPVLDELWANEEDASYDHL